MLPAVARRAAAVLVVLAVLLLWRSRWWARHSELQPVKTWNRTVPEWFSPQAFAVPSFAAPAPAAANGSLTLVVARTTDEPVAWLDELPRNGVEVAVYTADAPRAPFVVPRNKGNEVMAYLSYLVDFYDDLADVTVFMHGHAHAWHNADVLDGSAAAMVRALRADGVVRDGYRNLRCDAAPGCAGRLRPLAAGAAQRRKPEQGGFAAAWRELLPGAAVPESVAQACCSQFAVSRARVRARARQQYRYFRDWLLATQLDDGVAGRVWEYLWQVLWTGDAVHCPPEHACYCDAFGVCFDGPAGWDRFAALRRQRASLRKLLDDAGAARVRHVATMTAAASALDRRILDARARIRAVDADLAALVAEAKARGRTAAR